MRRPSPSMAVAVAAVVLAGAGGATAQTLITGADIRNDSVTGVDVRNRALRGKDIGSNTITGRNVSGLSGRDVIPNGLDGSDLDEDTLETVPRATRAATADGLSGVAVTRIAFDVAPATAVAVVHEAGGLRISAGCSTGGDLTAFAVQTTEAPGFVRVTVTHPGTPARTTMELYNDFAGTKAVDLVAGGAANASGRLVHRAGTGDTTTIDYLAHEGERCMLAGNAVHTAR